MLSSAVCPEQESNLHDQKRSLGPQPSASTNSAIWAEMSKVESKKLKVYKNITFNINFQPTALLRGAQNRTRTCTYLRILVPETSASTNSAIWAIYQTYLELICQNHTFHLSTEGGIGLPQAGSSLKMSTRHFINGRPCHLGDLSNLFRTHLPYSTAKPENLFGLSGCKYIKF